MKHFLYYIMVGLLLAGCRNDKPPLESYATITDIFDEAEIKDLTVILDFFNRQISATYSNDNEDIVTCYQRFFEWMAGCEITGLIDIQIPIEAQRTMYSQMSDQTFNQIWRIDQNGYRSMRDESDTLEIIAIRYDIEGKYAKFLQEYGKENSFIKQYYDVFEDFREITPSNMAQVMRDYNQLNMKDLRNQLFIAIHYLTYNDNAAEESGKIALHYPIKWYLTNRLTKASLIDPDKRIK